MKNQKVLVIKLSAIGDVLAATPVFRALRGAGYKNVDHLVMANSQVATYKNPFIRKQIIIPTLTRHTLIQSIPKLLYCIISLAWQRYDRVYILHRSPLLLFLSKLLFAKEIYGYWNKYSKYYNGTVKYHTNINRSAQELQVIQISGIKVNPPSMLDYFGTANTLPDSVRIQLPSYYITCNPGGGNAHSGADNRMWPEKRYVELIKQLRIPVVLLGSGESDKQKAKRIMDLVGDSAINLVDLTTFAETARVIKHSLCYVGNDSSLAFLSAALNVKGVILYGPTQSWAALPVGGRSIAVSSMHECSPCYDPYSGMNSKMYTCQNNVCMQKITVKTVVDEINSLRSN